MDMLLLVCFLLILGFGTITAALAGAAIANIINKLFDDK